MERAVAEGPLHPGPVELEQYLRGRLDPGHAAAILAHAASCRRCSVWLATATRIRLAVAPWPGREKIV